MWAKCRAQWWALRCHNIRAPLKTHLIITAIRTNLIGYTVLFLLGALVIRYQMRISLDTVHVERTLDFYVPFVIQPFTDRIDGLDYFMSWEAGGEYNPDGPRSVLNRRDEVLKVNGQPFRGASMYLRELWKTEHRPSPSPPNLEWHPFLLTIRSIDSVIRQIEVSFPHCTCGIPTMFQASSIWVIPPILCVILGLATVFLRPRSMLAWAFLAAMLSLSQLQVWPDWYTRFQQTASPMMWTNAEFRVFGVGYRALVQHIWPAPIILASAFFYRDRRILYRLAAGISGLFLANAALQAVLEIAWSEDYRRRGPQHPFRRVDLRKMRAGMREKRPPTANLFSEIRLEWSRKLL